MYITAPKVKVPNSDPFFQLLPICILSLAPVQQGALQLDWELLSLHRGHSGGQGEETSFGSGPFLISNSPPFCISVRLPKLGPLEQKRTST